MNIYIEHPTIYSLQTINLVPLLPSISTQSNPKPTIPYKHCEYHSLVALHVLPAAHTVGPDQPFPPHCPYLGAVATFVCVGGLEVVCVGGLEVVGTTVEPAVLDGVVALLLPPPGGLTTPPGPATEVVSSPDSMYTPLK